VFFAVRVTWRTERGDRNEERRCGRSLSRNGANAVVSMDSSVSNIDAVNLLEAEMSLWMKMMGWWA